MSSPIFISVDLSESLGKCSRSLGYWVSGQYLKDAAGNSKFVITDIKIEGQRHKVVLDI